MAAASSVTLLLTEEPTGPAIRLVAVGGSADNVLVDLRAVNPIDGLYPVRLLEDSEYVYEVVGFGDSEVIRLEPPELFFPDPDQAKRGRLRTGSYVGVLPIEVAAGGVRLMAVVEVQSRKLGYLAEYRWMLRDIANEATSLVLERFAPTRQRLGEDWTREPRSAYEGFVHLQALFADSNFEQAVTYVTSGPYVEWVEQVELQLPTQPIHGGSRLGRALSRPGARVAWPGGSTRTLPAKIAVDVTVPKVDNVPNRFVKHVLDHFLRLVNRVRDSLTSQRESASTLRGLREIAEIERRLEILRSAPLFRDVRDMVILPVDNQVILKRAGYREVLSAYLRVETGTRIAWADENMSGAQRKASTLYEYWAFLQLLRVIKAITPNLDISQLINETKDGLTLSLKQGRERLFHGTTYRLGRDLDLDLYYNRDFPPSPNDFEKGSWSMRMRPDCSLRLQARSDGPGIAPVWLHFDAKYKLSDFGLLRDVIGDEDLAQQPVRGDLLKMHAYLGAIRRSVGSYVLFPGTHPPEEPFKAYTEFLPGVGAFSLLPVAGGADTQALRAFLESVLTHVASVATQERRHRFWEHQIFPPESLAPTSAGLEPIEGLPPADTTVLLGFVRSDKDQWGWIQRTGLYNMRRDIARNGSVSVIGSEASARVLVLYSASEVLGAWRLSGVASVLTAAQLHALDYPEPQGTAYVCVHLVERISAAMGSPIDIDRVRALAKTRDKPLRSPAITTWAALTG